MDTEAIVKLVTQMLPIVMQLLMQLSGHHPQAQPAAQLVADAHAAMTKEV